MEDLVNEIMTGTSPMTIETRGMLQSRILELQSAMLAMPQIEVPLVHRFSKDVYAREITIPRGSLIVGKIHRHKNLNIISKGEVSFISIDGEIRVKAPHTFVASPGAKRVIFAHEDTVWTTIHGTSETDLEKIEDEFIAKDYEDLYLRSQRTLNDVLSILGTTEDQLLKISQNESDLIQFPYAVPVFVESSSVHGKGLFAYSSFQANEVIAPARIKGKRTPAGRYSNHSSQPNAKMVMAKNGDVDLISTDEIKSGDEILTDYFYNYTNTREQLCLG